MKKESIITCPVCNSKELSKPKYSLKSFAISVLLLGFPLIFSRKIYHCFDCTADFTKSDLNKNMR